MCLFDNIEVLADWNPDIILFSPYAFDTDGSLLYFGQEYVREVASLISNNPMLTTISAVQDRNLYPLSIHSSHYVVNSIRDLLRYMDNSFPELDQ